MALRLTAVGYHSKTWWNGVNGKRLNILILNPKKVLWVLPLFLLTMPTFSLKLIATWVLPESNSRSLKPSLSVCEILR